MCDLLRILVGQGGRRHGVSALGLFVTVTHWTTLSVEMAIELGCPCVSVAAKSVTLVTSDLRVS